MNENARAEAPNELVLSKRMELNNGDVGLQVHSSETHRSNAGAFTLAELLMAVLVISIIMVALAPVITRRAYDNVSIEVNKKKGLEIYTNPGTYTFDVPVGINTLFLQGSAGGGGGAGASYIDKSVSFTSNTTWTVPGGVNQITFVITGSGGGGGAGNGASTGITCKSDEFAAIRGSDDETDLCYMKQNRDTRAQSGQIGGFWNAGIIIAAPYTTQCSGGNCAWVWEDTLQYSYSGAVNVCNSYTSTIFNDKKGYRLPNKIELEKLLKNFDLWVRNGTLGLCTWNHCGDHPTGCTLESGPNIKQCNPLGQCLGMSNNWCAPFVIHGSDSFLRWNGKGTGLYVYDGKNTQASSVRCVKPLSRYTRFSGAGGASGAQLERTISVLPDDTLTITVGSGGLGGVYNSNSGKGGTGGTTQIVHKRGGVVLGTYYVKGGLGGFGASVSANGAAYANGTASNQSTPNGTCYANSNVGCSTISYSGNSGTSSLGGNGGRVKNTGTINQGSDSSGGYLYIDNTRGANQRNTTTEANYAKGQNAATAGFGGGGGLTPAWAASASNFYGGGKGASGKVDISYRVALPGGGGGSATRVGGTKIVADKETMYEIKYKVKEGDRVVFKIGSGGTGGVSNQDGINGEATVIGDDEIILLGGEGGKISTTSQKNSLIPGSGGRSSYVDENNSLYTNTLGIKVKGSNVSYTINPPSNTFKSENGFSGQLKNSSGVLLNYGFDGGLGASPFGIASNLLNQSRTCSGGTKGVNNLSAACPNNKEDANRALAHDPVNNQFGGSGGGGGGVIKDSFNLGQGGSGSSGYLRIRWDETENED